MKLADVLKLHCMGLNEKMKAHRDSLRQRLVKFEQRMGPAAKYRDELTRASRGITPKEQEEIPPTLWGLK